MNATELLASSINRAEPSSGQTPLRYSILKWMSRSPAHAKWALEHESPDTPQMRFGRLAHACFLGSNVPLVYPGERRGNAWKEFKAANADRDIVTEEEFQRASDMAAAVHQHKEARRLLMGRREQTIFFDYAGRQMRATPDAYAGGDDLADYKTTGDASPERFPWHALRTGYCGQLAFYKDAIKAAKLGEPTRLWIIAQEVKPPYAVCVHRLTPEAEEFGRRQYVGWLEMFLNCERSNEWPGYSPGVLDAPDEGVSLIGLDGEEIQVG